MKIRIQNFGPIHEFEFDLNKDLHFIYGKNNIGKSYAISLVYLVLKNLAKEIEVDRRDPDRRLRGKLGPQTETFLNRIKIFKEKLEGADLPYSVSEEIKETVRELLEGSFLLGLQDSFQNSFQSLSELSNRTSKQPFLITITAEIVSIAISIRGNHLFIKKISIEKDFQLLLEEDKIETPYMAIRYGDATVFPTPFTTRPFPGTDLPFNFHEAIYSVAEDIRLEFVRSMAKKIDQLYFLPASRSGLYEATSIFNSIFARLSQLRHLIQEKIEIPALPKPTSDYLLELSTINSKSKNGKFAHFADEAEKHILKGSVEFNDQNKKLEYLDHSTGIRFDLSNTSSMVAELSPLVAHLKYLFRPEDSMIHYHKLGSDGNGATSPIDTNLSKLLIIEEPETHLHPEVQVKLMTFFAKLAQHGLKIVLTTHSNYLFNKLSNLLVAGEIEKDRVAVYHLIQTEQGSQVSPDNPLTDTGLEDNNFVPVAEQLLQERLQMYQQSEG